MRFDALNELREKHPIELRGLSWNTVYDNPTLQIRAVVLKVKDNYSYYRKYSANELESLAFADAAYNGGIGGLDAERRACKLSSWCDHRIWFNNVEKICMKSRVPLYGNRSPCQINREHVTEVIYTRSEKYMKFLH